MVAPQRRRRVSPGRTRGGAGEQGTQAGVDADDIVVGQWPAQPPVGLLEEVVDVLPARQRPVAIVRPGRVGGAHQPVIEPAPDDEHAVVRLGDESGTGVDAVGRYDEVDALRRRHRDGLLAAQCLHLVGPDPGGVDDHPRGDLDPASALEIVHCHAANPAGGTEYPDDRRPGDDRRAKARGRAGQGHGVPRVVDPHVVVLHGAGDPVGAQVGHLRERGPPGQVSVAWYGAGAGEPEDVVQRHTRADVRPLPPLGEREQERLGFDQVRAEPIHHQVAFEQRLPDESEVELLEVAETTVEDLAGPRRRTAGEVVGLDQHHRQPAGHRVEGHAGTGDATADDHHVEVAGAERTQLLLPTGGMQAGPVHHRPRSG